MIIIIFYNWIKNCLVQEKQRIIHWIPVCFSLGVFLYFLPNDEPLIHYKIPILIILFFLLIIFNFLYKNYFIYFINGLIIIAMGFLWSNIRIENFQTLMLDKTIKEFNIAGKIIEISDPVVRGKDKKLLIIEPYNIDQKKCHGLVRLYSDQNIDLKAGYVINGIANLHPISQPSSPLSFDYRRYYFLKNICASGSIKEISISDYKNNFLEANRYKITTKIYELIKKPYGAIGAAIVTGDRSNIPKDVREKFVNAGIAHILAISGLHVGLIAGLVFFILRFFLALIPSITNRFLTKKLACIATIPITFTYLAISGFGIPAQRAFIMSTIAMLGIFFDRQPFSMRSVAIAAMFILVFFPESVLSPSFQLSFAAVIALIAFYEKFYQNYLDITSKLYSKNYLLQKLVSILSGLLVVFLTTLVATLATTPFTIYFFQNFTMQSILGNLLGIPLMTFLVMPACFLAILSLFFLDKGSSVLFGIWEFSIKTMVDLAGFVSSLPASSIKLATPHISFIILITFGGLWLCLWSKKWRYIGLIPIIFGISILFFNHSPDLYISNKNKLIAYRKDNILYVSKLNNHNQFIIKDWQKDLAIDNLKKWNKPYHKLGGIFLTTKKYINFYNSKFDDNYIISPYVIFNKNLKELILNSKKMQNLGTVCIWLTDNYQEVREIKVSISNRKWHQKT